MITPARSAVTRQLVIYEPSQTNLGLVFPFLVASRFVQPNKSSRHKAHAFAGVLLPDSEHGTQVKRETSYSLLENGAQESSFESQGAYESGIQAIKSVVA